jgi:hypothetical protein
MLLPLRLALGSAFLALAPFDFPSARTRTTERAALVHAVDRGGEHVELLGVGVLGVVVLARVGPEDLGRDHVGLAYEAGELLGCLEIDWH